MDEKPLKFEEALSRLEKVVETMENADTSLEDSISLYKEGAALSKLCNEILNQFEAEVKMLQKDEVC